MTRFSKRWWEAVRGEGVTARTIGYFTLYYVEQSNRDSTCAHCSLGIPKNTDRVTFLSRYKHHKQYGKGIGLGDTQFYHPSCAKARYDFGKKGAAGATYCARCRKKVVDLRSSGRFCNGTSWRQFTICKDCCASPEIVKCVECHNYVPKNLASTIMSINNHALYSRLTGAALIAGEDQTFIGSAVCDNCQRRHTGLYFNTLKSIKKEEDDDKKLKDIIYKIVSESEFGQDDFLREKKNERKH